MSRVLLTWEMGNNLGHLSRLLPLARRCVAHRHEVLVAARDVRSAATQLAPAGIPFVQAPLSAIIDKQATQPASYADLLRMHGWADVDRLGAAVQAWMHLFGLYSPAVLIADHSPTALLAARCMHIPVVLIATGFELPPARQPLPPFPGFSGATAEGAAVAESRVLHAVNEVITRMHAPPMSALRELFEVERRWLTSFPELDHYGERPEEHYLGPIGEIVDGEPLEWPSGSGARVFAYLRPGTPGLTAILQALGASGAAIVCWAPQVPLETLHPLRHAHISTDARPLDLRSLATEADVCVSYSPAGTVASTLLRSVPQLLAPAHLEAQMTAHRVECMGAGLTLRGRQDERTVGAKLEKLMSRPDFKARAHAFARRYRDFDAARAADEIVDQIEVVIEKNKNTGAHAR